MRFRKFLSAFSFRGSKFNFYLIKKYLGDPEHYFKHRVSSLVNRDPSGCWPDAYRNRYQGYCFENERRFIINNLRKENKRMCDCLLCGEVITDPDFKVVLYQEEYPDIEIGPYCESCFGKIKVCSKCHKPFKFHDISDQVCPACDTRAACGVCGSMHQAEDMTSINGITHCRNCRDSTYIFCDICKGWHSKDKSVEKSSLEGLQRKGMFKSIKVVCRVCFETNKKRFKKHDIILCNCCNHHKAKGKHDGYCDECYEQGYITKCSNCNEYHHSFSEVYSFKGDKYVVFCGACRDKLTYFCQHCQNVRLKSDGIHKKKTLLGAVGACEGCVKEKNCIRCNQESNSVDENGLCSTCRKIEAKVCGTCGSSSHIDDNGYCMVCDPIIHNYSYRQHLRFNYLPSEVPSDEIFFGFENEISFGSSGAKRTKALGELYKSYGREILTTKSDGSIQGEGFEIVTQPMTLGFFNKLDGSKMTFEDQKKKDNGCGFHIHINRESFKGDVHLYKVINFINSNTDFITKVAGRASSSYAKTIGGKISSHIMRVKKGGSSERYSNVNLQNKHTVEFRFCIGCNTEFEIRYRVEFIHSLICFQLISGISSSVDVDAYRAYVMDNKKKYPNIFKFIN